MFFENAPVRNDWSQLPEFRLKFIISLPLAFVGAHPVSRGDGQLSAHASMRAQSLPVISFGCTTDTAGWAA